MANKKVIFVAFAIEDERQRDFLKGQSLNTQSPFEYIDMSVKDAYSSEWKERVRTRIRRSDGLISLVSKNSLTSSGQKWEIACARVDLDMNEYVVIDPKFYRPAEVDQLQGDYSKAKNSLGWEPETSFEDMVTMMADKDLERVQALKDAGTA